MKIIAMLNGGGMPPFVYYQPVMTNNQQPSVVSSNTSSQTDTTDKGALGDKDLMSLLSKIDGLPVDMDAVYKKLNHFYRLQEAGINTRSLALTYLTAMKELKEAKFNKEQYNEAYKDVQKKSGLEETAIDNNGNVFFVDDLRNLQRLSVDAYLQNRDKIGMKPLTNHQLLLYRASNPTLTMNNNLLTVVSNGIGLSYINKLIKEASVNLGDTELSQTGYVKKEASNIMKGIEYLREAGRQVGATDQSLSLDGLYKAKYIRKDLAEQVSAAINYLYDVLPDNAKQLLKLKTGSQKGVLDFIVNSVARRASSTYRFTADLIEDEEGNKPGTKKSSGSSKSGANLSAPEAMVLGYGGSPKPVEINIGTSLSYNAIGRLYPLTHGSHPLPTGSSLIDVTGSDAKSILDILNATFGGSKLNDLYMQYSSIADADITCLELPIDKMSYAKGIIKPDLDRLKLQELADDEIRLKGISSNDYLQINEIYAEHLLPPKYILNNGEWIQNLQEYASFGMLYATLDDRAIADKDSFTQTLVEEIDDDNLRDAFVLVIKQKTHDKNYSIDGWFGGTKLYRGAVFIPIRQDLISASLTSSESSRFKLPTSDVKEVELRLALLLVLNEVVSRYNKAPSLSTLE